MAAQSSPLALELTYGYDFRAVFDMFDFSDPEFPQGIPVDLSAVDVFFEVRLLRSPSNKRRELVVDLSPYVQGTATGAEVILNAAEVLTVLPERETVYDFSMYTDTGEHRQELIYGTLAVSVPVGRPWEENQ